jgi:arylsulfatase A-like enzyme
MPTNPPRTRPNLLHEIATLPILVFATLALQSPEIRAQESDSASRPNIVLIMADDLGYGDLGCFGQQRIATPNIDRLAAEGMRLTDHYAGHTVCRPSRLVLLTGRHTGHTAISNNAPLVLKPGERTVTSLLETAGYATGGVGKWALGKPGTTGVPSKQGFDFWFGYLDQGEAHNFYPEELWRSTRESGEVAVSLPGNVVGKQPRVSIRRETWSHDVMTDEALEFVRHHAEGPFLLQCHYTVPHANNEGGRATGDGMEVPDYGRYAQEDWPNTEKGFAAMIDRLDRDVGRLVDLLKERGIEQRTLVIFTSDNGPHQEGGHRMEFFDSNGPLRGFKRDLYDGGIRVPTIAWWPGTIEAGTTSNHPSGFQDFLPTACELAGIEPPGDIDGISYLPTLLGREQPSHEYLYWQVDDEKSAVRQGSWKAVVPGRRQSLELYDLSKDVGEQRNVAGDHPAIVERMQAIIDGVRSGQ